MDILIYVIGALSCAALLGCLFVLLRGFWVDIKVIGPMEKRQNALYSRVDALVLKHEEDQKKIADMRGEITTLRGIVQAHEKEIAKLRLENATLRDERDADRDKIQGHEREIGDLRLENATFRCDIGKRDSKILELQELVAALQASVALKEGRIVELESAESARRTIGTSPLGK